MNFFDDNDPFEEIVRNFFGNSPIQRNDRKKQFIRGEEEDRTTDFVEDENNIYLIFELPGYMEKDISVIIKGGELEITAQKSNGESIQDYLHQKLRQGLHLKKELPSFVDTKKFDHSMRNGVLEIRFMKSKRGFKK